MKIFYYLPLFFFLVSVISPQAIDAAQTDRAMIRKKAERIALVIGNSNYTKGHLKNPANDAKAIAAVLKKSGFNVIFKTNLSKRQFDDVVYDFGSKLETAAVGLFYFAGHGMQINGQNYLLPINVRIESESDVSYEAVNAGRILGKMKDARCPLNIVILDACRDNPFRSFIRGDDTPGLAQLRAPSGSVIAYATQPGNVANDGNGNHSPYTAAMLRYINTPNLPIEQFFKQVRREVKKNSADKQIPWESTSLLGDFSFFGEKTKLPATLTVHTVPQDATVRITDISLQYRDGIALTAGSYSLEITAFGYQAITRSVRLAAGEKKEIRIMLLPKVNQVMAQPVATSTTSPSTYTDPITGMEFVLVKGGCYQMGDTFGDGYSDEKPVHEVCVDDFYMGKYEVTQGEWKRIMGNNPRDFKKGDNYPVENISWNDITKKFLPKLNSQSGKKYRLPTEAEWEYAAREGGKKVRFGNGKNIADPQEINFNGSKVYKKSYSKAGTYRQSTVPVNSFSANRLGLYNMSGNVWEWCSDWYSADYYRNSPRKNPQGVEEGSLRVIRGGCWGSNPRHVRSAYRYGYTPVDQGDYLGFRLVLSVY